MTMYWNPLKSMRSRMAPWLRVLSDRRHVMFNSFPRLGDAVGTDDLPVAFILKRDSRREKAGNGKRRYPMPGPVVKGIYRASGVHAAEHRAHARSTLRANVDRRNSRRAA
jgi:hypothetical protein